MKNRKSLLILSLTLALIFALLVPVNAIADDLTPPAPTEDLGILLIPTEEPVIAPTDEVTGPVIDVSSENLATISPESQQTDPSPTELPPLVEDQQLVESTAEIGQTLLDELPIETTIIVQVNGQIEPLATQAAEAAILVGDPIWCPALVLTPTPGMFGCTPWRPTLESLIEDIDNGIIAEPATDGTIWITNALPDASVLDIEIDGSNPNFTTWSNYNLTIQGGWDGTPAGTISGSSVFSVPISVVGWQGAVTVNNLTFDNVGSTGLTIETIDANIHLSNIISVNNAGGGSNGVELSVDDNLSITGGDITIDGVNDFSNNGGLGVNITGLVVNVDIGNVTADQNGDAGIYVEAAGDIVAENVTATGNGAIGAEFYAGGNATILGNNVFSDNTDTGLYIEADGDIFAENLEAVNNLADGVDLISLGGVTLDGANVFANNTFAGLYVEALGDVQASNVSAIGNSDGALFDISGALSLSGINEFSNNTFNGLSIDAIDNIFIENASVLNNGEVGMYLDTASNATVVCSLLSGNGDYEIEADTGGFLNLIGTNFGVSIDDDLDVDDDSLVLVSNNCFAYSFPSEDDEEDEDEDVGGERVIVDEVGFIVSPLPIDSRTGIDSQIIGLSCLAFSGTTLVLLNGDSVYIPCPIIDSARLAEVPEQGLEAKLPDGIDFVSAFILDIYANGQLVGLGNESGLIDFSSQATGAAPTYTYVYWNGSDWVEVTDQTFPFMNLSFVVPDDMQNETLAILYWDGAAWVELTDGAQFGNGREVGRGGHFEIIDGQMRFTATVNFTGKFVLAKK